MVLQLHHRAVLSLVVAVVRLLVIVKLSELVSDLLY